MKLILVLPYLIILALISVSYIVQPAEASDDPFNSDTQVFLLEWTANKMRIVNKECIPKPIVVHAEELPDDEFNKMIGFDTEGKRTNFFYPPDKILLVRSNKNHNLVHEFVHFLQYNCQGLKDYGTNSDVWEQYAVDIQYAYEEYRNPSK